jgi:hypothetical protein
MRRFFNWLRGTRGKAGTPGANHRFRPALDVLGGSNFSHGPGRPRDAVRPAVEHLEARVVPAVQVYYHGGPVVSHVDLETVYYGQDWAQAANQTNVQQLDGFAKTIAPSSYLAMLGEYGVGTGSFSQHDIVTNSQSPSSANPATATVSDAQIQAMLASEIRLGHLHESTGQQVYAVYLPPGITSANDSNDLAHHGSFTMQFPHIARGFSPVTGTYIWYVDHYSTDTVPYFVVPHPSSDSVWSTPGTGNAGQVSASWSNFQKQTEVTSHELAETLTNPAQYQDSSGQWHGGWWDDNSKDYLPAGNEIGDIANLSSTTLDGYVVQREWSNYFNRNIAPLTDTFGTPLGMGLPGWYSFSQISNGREQGLAFQSSYYPTQYQWTLPDGSGSGWFMPG